MQGQSQPWNVAIVIDATGFDEHDGHQLRKRDGVPMRLGRSDKPCWGPRIPARSGATSCTNSAANFHVALWISRVSTASVAKENACSSYRRLVPDLRPAIDYGHLVHAN